MSAPEIVLGQPGLALADFVRLARGDARPLIRDWSALVASREWLDGYIEEQRQGAEGAAIYGVTTGFGSFKNVRLTADQTEELQANLIRSHAVGVLPGGDLSGGCFSDEVVRGAALLRLHTFLAGRSGVRLELAELLLGLLEHDILPRVPMRGSVGASGDLCPLAHFALVLMGEGEASMPDGEGGRRVLAGAAALSAAGLRPIVLAAKEGLALINGTTFSTATLALALHDAMILVRTADVACALSFEAMGANGRALDPQVHASRGQVGQQDAAASLRGLLEGSSRISSTDDKQDVYSLRCTPVVHGASRDALSHVWAIVEAELSAVTDNPLLFALEGDAEPWDLREYADNPRRFGREPDRSPAYSAGNFHGQPIALAADLLAIALAEIASVSERRCAVLVNPTFSRGLPGHLASRPGLRSGFMLAQYTAASLVSENKTLAHPASVDSIPTGNGSEDHVSMSTWAARKARRVVDLTTEVIALELLVAAQANDWRTVLPDPSLAASSDEVPGEELEAALLALAPAATTAELGKGTALAQDQVRACSAVLVEDRSLAPDVAAVSQALRKGLFVDLSSGAPRGLRRSRFEAC